MRRYRDFFITSLIICYIFVTCSGTDYHYLSDYFKWIDSQPANIQKALMLASDAKDALFTYQLRDFLPNPLPLHHSRADFIIKASKSRGNSYSGIQFQLSYHKALRNTLMVYFQPTVSDDDACVDLQKGYQKVQLFSEQDGKNHIALHYGIVTSLFAKPFNHHFVSLMKNLVTAIDGNEIDHLIIAGHSMGGAHAQAFYILLHGDYTHVPGSIRALRDAIPWMDTTNSYDDETLQMKQCVINHENKDKIKVLTTGAFLILSTTYSNLNEHIYTGNVINFVKRKDPVPMVFGGTVTTGDYAQVREGDVGSYGSLRCNSDSLKQLMKDAREANENGLLGTATVFGKYYVVSKRQSEVKKAHRNYKKIRGQMEYDDRFEIDVRIAELVDGKYPYLSKHLKEGNKQLAKMGITVIPYTKWTKDIGRVSFSEVLFGLNFAMNHNEYYNDFESYIFSDKHFKISGNRNAEILFELRRIHWEREKDNHKRQTAAHRIESDDMRMMDVESALQRLLEKLHQLEAYQRNN